MRTIEDLLNVGNKVQIELEYGKVLSGKIIMKDNDFITLKKDSKDYINEDEIQISKIKNVKILSTNNHKK